MLGHVASYRITHQLGDGETGEVYAAVDVHLEKKFAIKLLRPESVSSLEATALIDHRNIIAIEAFGQLADGRTYVCMELLSGAALDDMIYRGVVGPGMSTHMEASRGLSGSAESAAAPAAQPLALDDNVQFTVYRPRAINPMRWYSLLAFAHLAERRPGELDAPDPIDEVRRQAEVVLGERAATYQSTTQDSGAAIPAEGELVFAVEIPGIEVNPPCRSFL